MTSDAPHDAVPPRRPVSAAAALRALLEEADAFGLLGFGTERSRGPGAPSVAATTDGGETRPPERTAASTEPLEARASSPSPPPSSAAAASAPTRFPEPADDSGDDDASRRAALARIAEEAEACRRCPLGGLRTRAVPGQGNPRAEFFFAGEAPGAEEDASGLAFVGPAGQLLTRMIEAMGLKREDVYIANVLKCRPPMNRDPAPDEIAQCSPFLHRQLAIVRPRVVICLGGHAARTLIPGATSVGRLRGTAQFVAGAPAVATYHPSYLLRAPSEKAKAWEDLKAALRLVGREPPPRGGGGAG